MLKVCYIVRHGQTADNAKGILQGHRNLSLIHIFLATRYIQLLEGEEPVAKAEKSLSCGVFGWI